MHSLCYCLKSSPSRPRAGCLGWALLSQRVLVQPGSLCWSAGRLSFHKQPWEVAHTLSLSLLCLAVLRSTCVAVSLWFESLLSWHRTRLTNPPTPTPTNSPWGVAQDTTGVFPEWVIAHRVGTWALGLTSLQHGCTSLRAHEAAGSSPVSDVCPPRWSSFCKVTCAVTTVMTIPMTVALTESILYAWPVRHAPSRFISTTACKAGTFTSTIYS